MTPIWKRRQKWAFEAMWRDIERKRRRERFIAGPLGWIVEVPSFVDHWRVWIGLVIIISVVWAMSALAQTPVPPECFELAKREGFPTDTMTKTQLARAKLKLSRLSDDDPIVRSCRYAVAQLRAMKQ